MIENQKYYYSDPICRTFDWVHLDHSSTRDVNFGSLVSPIIVFPGLSFSVLGFGSRALCKIRVPGLGSNLKCPGSRVLGTIFEMCPGSRVSGPTKSNVSRCMYEREGGFPSGIRFLIWIKGRLKLILSCILGCFLILIGKLRWGLQVLHGNAHFLMLTFSCVSLFEQNNLECQGISFLSQVYNLYQRAGHYFSKFGFPL